MEETLDKYFLSEIFKSATVEVPLRGITRLLINQSGLDTPNQTLSDWENWTASCVVTGHLVKALHRKIEFKTGDHYIFLKDGKGKTQRHHK